MKELRIATLGELWARMGSRDLAWWMAYFGVEEEIRQAEEAQRRVEAKARSPYRR